MPQNFIIHTPEEIARIRIAGHLTAQVRDEIAKRAVPGMSTWEIDRIAGEIIRATGGTSAFLGYSGYPGNICISVNDEVIHGIGRPDRIIREEDIVSIDVGVVFDGAMGDSATTFGFGPQSADRKRLLSGTEEALHAGIKAAVRGRYVKDIALAVERCAHRHGLGIVREYTGHGCGIRLHEPPEVPNYCGWGSGPRLVPGMVLCIEPMLNLGRAAVELDRQDCWTVRTRDGSDSAHFEHMILITDSNPEILTKWQKTM